MTEYIILVGVIALLAIAAFKIFGSKVSSKIQQQSTSVDKVQG
jgi:pilus assembly protein Flp/PilA